MPKGEKTGLGRALVKHHNQMVQESKAKGKYYRNQQKKVLESVTEVSDIEAVIEQADEANRLFSAHHPPGKLPISLDSASSTIDTTAEEKREQQKKEEALHASSLRIPRRPPWNAKMTVEELDDNERRAFLEWRRSLARLEDNENLVLTPFEKNLDIWRQLWRVLERSDLLVMVVDARDPLFYRCPDLEAYAREIDEHKRTLLLVNKADLLPLSVREQWVQYFHQHGILFVFWSAKAASAALEGKSLNPSSTQEDSLDADTKIYGRDELLARLQSEAEEIVSVRRHSRSSNKTSSDIQSDHAQGVMVGFVGYPNVGKSSTINALVGEKKTGVTSTPGKTKHFQTLIISEKLTLCDCPGLVFPSFTSSRYEMVASGVLPIDRMTEHREAVQVVANRVPRSVIENAYRIALPKPKPYERQSRPPLAAELLRTYCASRGYVAARGLPDETKAARQILKDYIDGKLMHFELPPGTSDTENDSDDAEEGIASESDSDNDEEPSVSEHHGSSHLANRLGNLMKSSDMDNGHAVVQMRPDSNLEPSVSELHGGSHLADMLDDLKSFDMDNGFASMEVAVKKKLSKAPHKQHKKPQRKKDRSWRVGGGEGDGMPVVRVFQKPAVP